MTTKVIYHINRDNGTKVYVQEADSLKVLDVYDEDDILALIELDRSKLDEIRE